MRKLNPDRYGPQIAALWTLAEQHGRPATLAFGSPLVLARPALLHLRALPPPEGKRLHSPASRTCLEAGLWLLFDFMAESHELCQGVEQASGSYWHAILHRREPDPGNSRYWWSRVGTHPVFSELSGDARALAAGLPEANLGHLAHAGAWDPDEFVRLCAQPAPPPLQTALLAIQRREIELLFEHDFNAAYQG